MESMKTCIADPDNCNLTVFEETVASELSTHDTFTDYEYDSSHEKVEATIKSLPSGGYCQSLTGIFKPPVNGEYTFYVSGSGNIQLWMDTQNYNSTTIDDTFFTNDNNKIAELDFYNNNENQNNWRNYFMSDKQISESINLTHEIIDNNNHDNDKYNMVYFMTIL